MRSQNLGIKKVNSFWLPVYKTCGFAAISLMLDITFFINYNNIKMFLFGLLESDTIEMVAIMQLPLYHKLVDVVKTLIKSVLIGDTHSQPTKA